MNKSIPTDWKRVNLGSSCDYVKGYAFKSQDYRSSGVQIIRVSDLGRDRIESSSPIFLDTKDKDQYKKWELKENDIIFTTVGSKPPMYDSLVGRAILVDRKNSGKLLNQNALLIRSKDKTFNNYIYNFFSTKRYIYFIENIVRGNANQGNITLNDLFEFEFHLPPLPEQHRIVAILETWDKALEAITQKIELKKNIKKGLMQELLTGKRRIEGFSGEWETVKVKNIFTVTRGNVLAVKEMQQSYSDKYHYPVYSSQTKNNGLTGYYTDFLFENAITWTTDGANAGDVKYRKDKFYCTNVCGVLLSDKGYTNPFISETLNHITQRYVSYVGNPKLMNGVMAEIPITVPSIDEQSAIAQILTTADNEITALEKKKQILEDQKKFLLNNLITGQIRTPENLTMPKS